MRFHARRDERNLTCTMALTPITLLMKKCIGKILLSIALCFLIGNALGGTSEPVRLFVKEVPLKVLGKELTVIAIEQADGTQGFSPEKADGFHVGSGEPVEGADEHSLARTHFTEPYGRRSLRHPGSHSARQIVSL